jgi:hypothetical protein
MSLMASDRPKDTSQKNPRPWKKVMYGAGRFYSIIIVGFDKWR